MNYRQLLKKYINHVGIAEGVTFLEDFERSSRFDSPNFTDEEWAKLKELEAEDPKLDTSHSCSCHTQRKGPCDVCKDLGCLVWDFNEVRI